MDAKTLRESVTAELALKASKVEEEISKTENNKSVKLYLRGQLEGLIEAINLLNPTNK